MVIIQHNRVEVIDKQIYLVIKYLKKGKLSEGEGVNYLERKLSHLFDGAEVAVVSSGTSAIYLALVAAGIGHGKVVCIPSYTCRSLLAAVRLSGAQVVCSDCARNSVNITFSSIRSLEDKLDAVIVPHNFGFISDIGTIKTRLKTFVIEDIAHGWEREPDGKGKISGDVAVTSFYATKLFRGAEGGACISYNKDLIKEIKKLRDCDHIDSPFKAFNFKLSDIHAALVTGRLSVLKHDIEKRNLIARKYDEVFGKYSLRFISKDPQDICFRYLIKISDSDIFLKSAIKKGIECKRPVIAPLHYEVGGRCIYAEENYKTLVSIPLYPELKKSEINRIIKQISSIIKL